MENLPVNLQQPKVIEIVANYPLAREEIPLDRTSNASMWKTDDISLVPQPGFGSRRKRKNSSKSSIFNTQSNTLPTPSKSSQATFSSDSKGLNQTNPPNDQAKHMSTISEPSKTEWDTNRDVHKGWITSSNQDSVNRIKQQDEQIKFEVFAVQEKTEGISKVKNESNWDEGNDEQNPWEFSVGQISPDAKIVEDTLSNQRGVFWSECNTPVFQEKPEKAIIQSMSHWKIEETGERPFSSAYKPSSTCTKSIKSIIPRNQQDSRGEWSDPVVREKSKNVDKTTRQTVMSWRVDNTEKGTNINAYKPLDSRGNPKVKSQVTVAPTFQGKSSDAWANYAMQKGSTNRTSSEKSGALSEESIPIGHKKSSNPQSASIVQEIPNETAPNAHEGNVKIQSALTAQEMKQAHRANSETTNNVAYGISERKAQNEKLRSILKTSGKAQVTCLTSDQDSSYSKSPIRSKTVSLSPEKTSIIEVSKDEGVSEISLRLQDTFQEKPPREKVLECKVEAVKGKFVKVNIYTDTNIRQLVEDLNSEQNAQMSNIFKAKLITTLTKNAVMKSYNIKKEDLL